LKQGTSTWSSASAAMLPWALVASTLVGCGAKVVAPQVDEPWRTRPKDALGARGGRTSAGEARSLLPVPNGLRLGPVIERQADGAVVGMISDVFGKSVLTTLPLLPDGLPRGPRADLPLSKSVAAWSLRPLALEGAPSSPSAPHYAVAVVFPATRVEAPRADEPSSSDTAGTAATPDEDGDTPSKPAPDRSIETPGEISVVPLDALGRAARGPIAVARVEHRVVWNDVVALEGRRVAVLWVEDDPSGSATLFGAVTTLSDATPSVGSRVTLARAVSSWQARRSPRGLDLAWITRGTRGTGRAALLFSEFDQELRSSAVPLAVSGGVGATRDIDFVRRADRVTLAWAAPGTGPNLMQWFSAEVDPAGRSSTPKKLAEVPDTSDLETLVPTLQDPLLVWRSPRAGSPLQEISIANVNTGRVWPQHFTVSRGAVEWQVAGDRVFAHYDGCLPGDRTCAAAMAMPRLVAFDANLVTIRELALRGQFTGKLTQSWGLSCRDSRCTMLGTAAAADENLELTSYSLDLAQAELLTATRAPRADAGAAPKPAAGTATPPEPPSASAANACVTDEDGSLALSPEMAPPMGAGYVPAVAATPTAGGVLVAWVGGGSEPATAPSKRPGYPVYTAWFGARGESAAPVRVATRAEQTGGLALAAASAPNGDRSRASGFALGWVAIDDGDPQVHVTQLDRLGRRVNEVQISSVRGNAGSVAITALPDGFLVGWADGRFGESELMAARFDGNLKRLTREERITSFGGAVTRPSLDPLTLSSLSLAHRNGTVWASFVDQRGTGSQVYAVPISAKNAGRAGALVQLHATDQKATAPAWFAVDDGAPGTADGGARLGFVDATRNAFMVARFSRDGALTAAPAEWRRGIGAGAGCHIVTPGREASAVGLQCGAATDLLWLRQDRADLHACRVGTPAAGPAVVVGEQALIFERRGGTTHLVRRWLRP
jgi:hypothetical protein